MPEDVGAFVQRLNDVDAQPEVMHDLFAEDASIFLSRAPGRMDVMGGIADYSGSLVLQMPIREAAVAGVQQDMHSRQIQLVSLGAVERSESFTFQLDDFIQDGSPVDYETARAFFAAAPVADRWAAYLGGAFLVLMRECGAHFAHGCRILLDSQVPDGKGVSSSAAIEVATMHAICGAYHIKLAPRTLALLCQKVENLVVGAPCGVMDQMASACGEEGQLLAILCQPAELLDSVALPEDLAVWGIDSGIRHAVSGADYGSVRTGAFMGLEILRQVAGVRAGPDDRWGWYLANVTPHEWLQHEPHVPERLTGAAFLETHDGIADTVTHVDPQHEYGVRPSTAHQHLGASPAPGFCRIARRRADTTAQRTARRTDAAEPHQLLSVRPRRRWHGRTGCRRRYAAASTGRTVRRQDHRWWLRRYGRYSRCAGRTVTGRRDRRRVRGPARSSTPHLPWLQSRGRTIRCCAPGPGAWLKPER